MSQSPLRYSCTSLLLSCKCYIPRVSTLSIVSDIRGKSSTSSTMSQLDIFLLSSPLSSTKVLRLRLPDNLSGIWLANKMSLSCVWLIGGKTCWTGRRQCFSRSSTVCWFLEWPNLLCISSTFLLPGKLHSHTLLSTVVLHCFIYDGRLVCCFFHKIAVKVCFAIGLFLDKCWL